MFPFDPSHLDSLSLTIYICVWKTEFLRGKEPRRLKTFVISRFILSLSHCAATLGRSLPPPSHFRVINSPFRVCHSLLTYSRILSPLQRKVILPPPACTTTATHLCPPSVGFAHSRRSSPSHLPFRVQSSMSPGRLRFASLIRAQSKKRKIDLRECPRVN